MGWIKRLFGKITRTRKPVNGDERLIKRIKYIREELKNTVGMSKFYRDNPELHLCYANAPSFVSSTNFIVRNHSVKLNRPTRERLKTIERLYLRSIDGRSKKPTYGITR